MSLSFIKFAPINGKVVIGEPTQFEIVFSEPVTNLELSDFKRLSLDLSNLRTTDNGTSWLIDMVATSDDSVIRLEANSYQASSNTPAPGKTVIIQYSAPKGEVIVNDITADNIIDAAEAEQDIIISGNVTGNYIEGDNVTITVNGIDYLTTLQADGSYSVAIAGSELILDSVVLVQAVINNGITGIATTSHDYIIDLSIPPILTIDDITSDNAISYYESQDSVDVTGNVDNHYEKGGKVIINIGDDAYSTTLNADGTFSVNVHGMSLATSDIVTGSALMADTDYGTLFDTQEYSPYVPPANVPLMQDLNLFGIADAPPAPIEFNTDLSIYSMFM